MERAGEHRRDERAVVLAPLEADAQALARELRDHGLAAEAVDGEGLETALSQDVFVLILTEEALTPELISALADWAAEQPDWSVLPCLVLLRDAARGHARLAPLFSDSPPTGLALTVLERPTSPELFRNAVLAAVASRRGQHRIRDQIAELDFNRRTMELLAHEVQHRAKNSLSRLISILRQTRRSTEDAEAALDRFEERLHALARGQDLLSNRQWLGADLRALVALEVQALDLDENARLRCDGAHIELSPDAALSLHLVLHELATNAVKYGSLSVQEGRIDVRWAVERGADDETPEELVIGWVESGGPRIEAPPERKGFGSQLVDLVVRGELGGTIEIDYRPEGLACTVRLPVAKVVADRNAEASVHALARLVGVSSRR